MLSVVEKAIFLQEVDVFSEVAAEQLAYLAAIATEQTLEPRIQVFPEGAPADCMYLVVEGSVRLHRGRTDIMVAKAGDAFGTWALFDEEPRMLSATVLEERTEVLVIDRLDFVEVLADNVEITRGVLLALTRRLRSLGRAIEKG